MSDETKTTDQVQGTDETKTTTQTDAQATDKAQGADEGKAEAKPKAKSKPKGPDPEEKVDFTAPYDPTGEKRDILLAVNGETARVKLGTTVQIKRKFVEVYENSVAQTYEARRAQEKAQEQAKAPILNM